MDTANLLDNILRSIFGHDLGELLGLLVVGDLLETEGHLDGVEEVLDALSVLSKLGSGADEALLAGELSERSTTDTLDGIFQVRVANSLDDLLDVSSLSLLVDLVLGDDQALGLHKSTADLSHDLLILESIVDGALSSVVAVVSSGGVASVDGEELALDEGSKVVDPVDTLDVGDTNVLERSAVNNPLEELLKCNVEAGVGVLGWDDSVDGRVGVASSQVVVLETRRLSVAGILDVLSESVCGTDGVLASDDMERSVVRRAGVDTLCDNGSDELEDVGADGAGDDLGCADGLDEVLLMCSGVDGLVVCDCVFGGSLRADLNDLVGGGFVDEVDDGVVDIGENDIVAGVVKEASDEAAT